MIYNTKKRFIAGAICPRCETLDKIVVYSFEGKNYRECIHCNFKDELHFSSSKRELNTRVNNLEGSDENQVQVVNIVPLRTKNH